MWYFYLTVALMGIICGFMIFLIIDTFGFKKRCRFILKEKRASMITGAIFILMNFIYFIATIIKLFTVILG